MSGVAAVATACCSGDGSPEGREDGLQAAAPRGHEAALAKGDLFDALQFVSEACADPGEAQESWGACRADVARRLREELAAEVSVR